MRERAVDLIFSRKTGVWQRSTSNWSLSCHEGSSAFFHRSINVFGGMRAADWAETCLLGCEIVVGCEIRVHSHDWLQPRGGHHFPPVWLSLIDYCPALRTVGFSRGKIW